MGCSHWWAYDWELNHSSVGWDWELCLDELLAPDVQALVPLIKKYYLILIGSSLCHCPHNKP